MKTKSGGDVAADFEVIAPGVFRWQIFSPAHQVVLSSHAVAKGRRLYIFDPIALAMPALRRLLLQGSSAVIILTNSNHERVSADWRRVCQGPIFASTGTRVDVPQVRRFSSAQRSWLDWRLHPIDGATAGEMAFELKGGSLMVFGDAVTNLSPKGLSLLPEKYCLHLPTLRHSMRQMLFRVSFDRALFAHGEPLLTRASESVAALV